MTYDHIVVGGGTAGAIVAARLSEDRNQSVLLLEAGPDHPAALPAELLDASVAVTSGFNWDLQATAADDPPSSERAARVARVFELAAGRTGGGAGPIRFSGSLTGGVRMPYPMAKVVGGGSSINAALAFRARPEDFASWAAAGNEEWAWERVRGASERIEDEEPDRPRLPIELARDDQLTGVQEAFLAACLDRGWPRVDLRQGLTAGVGGLPKNLRDGRRVSTAALYLTAARRRENLTIQARCQVDRLVVERSGGELGVGAVEGLIDGERHRFSGGQVVLAAGAVHSPAILLRSGIGAAAALARLGIEPRLDLPGVGENLADHPSVSLWAAPKPGACAAGEMVHQVMLQVRSSPSEPLCDLQFYMLGGLPTAKLPPLAEVVGAELAIGLSVILATPRSRGRVELVDRDPLRDPRIDLRCLSDERDLARLKVGLRSAWDLFESDRIVAQRQPTVLWERSVFESERRLERLIRTTVRGAWHPVGTLRMGGATDRLAVVDQRGRVHGCRNVAVADGSIMPSLPSVPTNLTCMLIAERIADDLRGRGF